MLRNENFPFQHLEKELSVKNLATQAIKSIEMISDEGAVGKNKELLIDTILDIASEFEKGSLKKEIAASSLFNIIEVANSDRLKSIEQFDELQDKLATTHS